MIKFKLNFIRLTVIILLLFAGNIIQITCGQNFVSPVDIPLVLSSNFGELRADMFHFGIDITTNSLTGLNVYAIDSGYVSRIKVESGGYGRALYITHNNGYTSVYAHLLCYNQEIDKYCKEQQYKKRAFSVDLNLEPGLIKIHKGQLIAWSGNAGNTTGPHLHLEIREGNSQATLNILRYFSFDIPDTIPPVLEKLWIYRFEDDSTEIDQYKPLEYRIVQGYDGLKLLNNPEIEIPGKIAFGLEGYDIINKSSHKTGIYEISLIMDNKLIFDQQLNKLDWDEMRYVNSLMDYGLYLKYGDKINRLYIQPNNKLKIYNSVVNNGIININDTISSKFEIIVKDASLNESKLYFTVKGKPGNSKKVINNLSKEDILMHCNKENYFERENIKLLIPQNSLYSNLYFKYKQLPAFQGYLSQIQQIGNSNVPLHKSALLSVKPFNVKENIKSKLLLVNIDEHGKIIWSGGEYKNGFVQAYILFFGKYAVAVDTIPPTITPVTENIKDDNYADFDRIQFIIKDSLSGINKFKGYIDGQWALFEYDAKENLLYYEFDPVRMHYNIKHTIYLDVTDKKGNLATYISTFIK